MSCSVSLVRENARLVFTDDSAFKRRALLTVDAFSCGKLLLAVNVRAAYRQVFA